MKKTKSRSAIFVIVVVILFLAYFVYFFKNRNTQIVDVGGYKNTSYLVEGQSVVLVNGRSEVSVAPDSASKIVTQYFGNEAIGDLNGDGLQDIAFVLTQNTGGSGTFYYVVAALKTQNGYIGTNAIFLGDRIAPQTTQIQNGTIVVNYADRKLSDPMTTAPSIGVSKYLKISDGKLHFL